MCLGSFRSFEKKKNRYGPLCRTVGLTESNSASLWDRLPILLLDPANALRLTRGRSRFRRGRDLPSIR
jgi:hypothetical protein